MNIQYAEILCHFMKFDLNNETLNESSTLPKTRMLGYVESLITPQKKRIVLKNENLKAALPMIWFSIQNCDTIAKTTLLTSLFTYFETLNVMSASTFTLFTFITRIIFIESHSTEKVIKSAMKNLTKVFIANLPKLLWKLKSSNVEFSQDVVGCCLRVVRENVFGICDDKIWMKGFCKRYGSVFSCVVKGVRVYGPFSSMNDDAKKISLDIIEYLDNDVIEGLVEDIVGVITGVSTSADACVYFLDILGRKGGAVFVRALFTVGVYGYTKLEAGAIEGVCGYDEFVERKISYDASCSNSGKRKRDEITIGMYSHKMNVLNKVLFIFFAIYSSMY